MPGWGVDGHAPEQFASAEARHASRALNPPQQVGCRCFKHCSKCSSGRVAAGSRGISTVGRRHGNARRDGGSSVAEGLEAQDDARPDHVARRAHGEHVHHREARRVGRAHARRLRTGVRARRFRQSDSAAPDVVWEARPPRLRTIARQPAHRRAAHRTLSRSCRPLPPSAGLLAVGARPKRPAAAGRASEAGVDVSGQDGRALGDAAHADEATSTHRGTQPWRPP